MHCRMVAENVTDVNVTNLDCPVWTDEETDDFQIDMLSFWLEGITQFIVAIFGLIGNSISAFILSRYVCTYNVRLTYLGRVSLLTVPLTGYCTRSKIRLQCFDP